MFQPDLLVVDEAQNKPKPPLGPLRGLGVLWYIIAHLSSTFAIVNSQLMLSNNSAKWINENLGIFGLSFPPIFAVASVFYIHFAYVNGRHVLSYPIGRLAKFKMDVITFTAALIWRLWLYPELNWFSLFALVSFTVEYHAIRQLLHSPSDVGFRDMFIEVAMQCAVFLFGHNVYVSLVVFMSCGGLSFFRFFFYSDSSTTLV